MKEGPAKRPPHPDLVALLLLLRFLPEAEAMIERIRFRLLLAEHAAAIGRLRAFARAQGPSTRESRGGPLRAVFLSSYPPKHYGTVFRLSRWVPHLESRGIEVRILCATNDDEYEAFRGGTTDGAYRFHRSCLDATTKHIRAAADADVLLLHRGLMPFGPWQRPTFERLLQKVNPRIVYDLYDSVWVLRQAAHRNAESRSSRWLNPPDLIEDLVRLSAATTVSNEYLAAFARPLSDRVRILPMVLDPTGYRVREHREAETVTLGWMGGPWNVARLMSIAPALQKAAERTSIRLRVVSAEHVSIPGVLVDSLTHPWSEESETRDLERFDVGLLPMFDDPEDRGKSPLKLLQYAAAGLPVIATPVAVDREAFVPDEAILFAGNEEEWTEQIVRLAGDPALRARLGAAARRALDAHFTYEAHSDELAGLLREVATSGRGVRRG